MPLLPGLLPVTFIALSLCLHATTAEVANKGDRGDEVTLDTVSTSGTRDLAREATGWRQTYMQSMYPSSGGNKGWPRTNYGGGYQGGYQTGYPMNTGGYGGSYYPPNRGGYISNQGGYGTSKGWSSGGSSWGGNSGGRPWSGGYGGNYKGSTAGNQGWYGGQSSGWQGGVGDRWYGGNQLRPTTGGYNWPSRGYRGDKGYSGSYGGSSWGNLPGYGSGNQPGYGSGNQPGYGSGNPSYSSGYNNPSSSKGLGNQIYGSGYGGSYSGQKGWGSGGYNNINAIPGSQGNTWGGNPWDQYGYQGNYKGGTPRINNVKGWSGSQGGYMNYPSNQGWYK